MNEARYGHGCSLFTLTTGDMKLIITGGYTTLIGMLSSVEISTKTGSGWSSFVKTDNALPAGRWFLRTTLVRQLLYTVGGITSSIYEARILVSEDGTTWTTSTTTLTTGRHAHTAVAIADLC